MDFLLHFGPSHYNDLFRENPYFSFSHNGDLKEFCNYYIDVRKKAGKNGLICLPTSNHDMPRIARRLNADELKAAYMFILSMPGAPFIYYGDEIGMRYLEDLPSVEGGYERTGSRTPMQWDETINAGFSSAKPEDLYIKIDPDINRPNVKNQSEDPNSVLNFVKKMIVVRQENPVLQSYGDFAFIEKGENDGILAYKRGNGDDAIYCVFNTSKKEQCFKTDVNQGEIEAIICIGNFDIKLNNSVLTVAPYSSALFKIKN